MDPNSTLQAILENLTDLHLTVTGGEIDPGYRENAALHLRALAGWLDRDGFPLDAESVVRKFAVTLD